MTAAADPVTAAADPVTAAAGLVIAVVERAHLILMDSFQTRKIKHC